MTIITDSNDLFTGLTADLSVTIPSIDLTNSLLQIPTSLTDEMYQHISGPENVDLTTRTVGGAGIFDALMASTSAHLKAEFDKGRITGAEYTKAYIELTQASMTSAVAFALGKQQAFWTAQQAQIAAISSRVQLEMVKVNLAKLRIETETSEAQYAQAKIQLALTSAQLEHVTSEIALLGSQKIGQDDQNAILAYNLSTVLPGQVALTSSQKLGQDAQNSTAAYNLSTVLPSQVALNTNQAALLTSQTALTGSQKSMVDAQIQLVAEQKEVQRAQTLDTRTDGATITGAVGQQKALYAQQIISYKRDAEVKAAKLVTDAWTVQKTVDDALTPPDAFTNSSVDTVMTAIKTNNGLV